MSDPGTFSCIDEQGVWSYARWDSPGASDLVCIKAGDLKVFNETCHK